MEQELKKHPDYPEEYITGKVNFFGRDFRVTPHVLIPRLETEMLVRRARTLLHSQKFAKIVDIGCGSGIIGVSVADLVEEVIFLDISREALDIAEANFRAHFPEKKAQFILSDLLGEYSISEEALLLINLPYIKGGDWKNMSDDTRYEPEIALFGGDDTGFEIYERLFSQLSTLDLSRCTLIIEFGFDQREIAEEVISRYGWKYEFFSDYAGIERFCEILIL